MPSDKEIKKAAKEIATSTAFIVGFANALVKLRKAEKANEPVHLTSDEVKSVMAGFRNLREGLRGSER